MDREVLRQFTEAFRVSLLGRERKMGRSYFTPFFVPRYSSAQVFMSAQHGVLLWVSHTHHLQQDAEPLPKFRSYPPIYRYALATGLREYCSKAEGRRNEGEDSCSPTNIASFWRLLALLIQSKGLCLDRFSTLSPLIKPLGNDGL